MEEAGFYIIKETFFRDMADPYLKGNKEENRPHYYCFWDSKEGVYWMIPLSSRVEKYQRIIDKRTAEGKRCDTLHIVRLDNGRENAFLIQDIFPVTEAYVERKYTVGGNHLRLTSEHVAKEIERKARRVVGMLKRGIRFTPTQPNVAAMLEKLQAEGTKTSG